MSKYRVYELAKEFHTDTKNILDILKKNHFKAVNNFSSVGDAEHAAVKNHFAGKSGKSQEKAAAPAPQPEKRAPQPKQEVRQEPKRESGQAGGETRRRSENRPAERRTASAHSESRSGSHSNGSHSNESRSSENRGGENRGNRGGDSRRNGGNGRNDRNGRNGRSGRNDRTENRGGRNDRRGGRNDRRGGRNNRRGGRQQPAPKVEIARPTHIKLPESIAVKDLASKMSYTAAEVVKKLFMMGVMATINQEIDFETAALVASEFGVTCEELPPDVDPTEIPEIEDDPKSLKLRPPVVTVMGHVDHGKTSLLDCIRNTHVQTHEAGGITQHIGAYQVNCKGKKIVFLDTPGHEAFTAMRARGAQITDIAILVVAAEDGIKPQTVESINHAKAAGIPIIVAINKMDKPDANPERIKEQLTKYDLLAEDWGGDTIVCPISAKTGMGVDNLLEMVALTAEVGELKANPNRAASGAVIEARLDKGRGPIATLLVQNGTLHQGDIIIAGTAVGRVRMMTNDKGQKLTSAGPSVPVEITGLGEVPGAGANFNAVADERLARELVEQRKAEEKAKANAPVSKVSLEDLFSQIQAGEMKNLNIIVKADVQGSVEAVKASLEKISNDEVRVRVIHGAVGAINESDVMLAATSNAIIVGFNVRPDAAARDSAARAHVDMRMYRVIYDAINEIEAAMKGMLAPKFRENVIGHAEIRQTFKVSNVGTVAGCYVTDGKIQRSCEARIVRDGIVIHEGHLASLQRFKDAVKEVASGYECGLNFEKFNDIKEGDVVEAYVMEQIEQ